MKIRAYKISLLAFIGIQWCALALSQEKSEIVDVILLQNESLRVAQEAAPASALAADTVRISPGVTLGYERFVPGCSGVPFYYVDTNMPDFITFESRGVSYFSSTNEFRLRFGLGVSESAPNGFYDVVLTYHFHNGVEDKCTAELKYVVDTHFIPAPAANFSGTPISGVRPLRVQFTDESTGQILSRLWDFGDGFRSTQANPSNFYTSAGTYTVTLTVTGPGGSDTMTRENYITVSEPPPTAFFSGSPRSGVKPLTVQFSDLSSGQITSRSWNFGDGKTSDEKSPLHVYNEVGTFTVALTVTGPGGSDTTTRENYITVREPVPVADFTGSPTSGVKPLAVQFTDLSTGQITSRSWNFGDGQTSAATNPSHTYTVAGTYTVRLTVTGPGGSNTKTQTGYITVNEPAPVADFSGAPTIGVKPLTVQFSDKSVGVITVRSWNFGDGQTSTLTNPSHTYADTGTYTVVLTVAGPGGTDTKTREKYITVKEGPPVPDFTGSPTSGVKPLTVQFTDRSSGQITSRSWSFGDGQTSSEASPVHVYENAGSYTVSLTVSGPGGSSSKQQTNYITVLEPRPTADFIATPTSGVKPLTVQFNDKSDGVISSRAWDFGDGQTSTAANPLHTYVNAGTYTVSFTVTGPGGSNTRTRENYITVNGPPVVANAIPGTMLRVGGAAFTRDLNAPPAVFTDPEGDTLSYTASSSNPSVAGANMAGSVLSVSPAAVGSAAITITAVDGKSGEAATVFDVQVLPVPPAAPTLVSPSNGAVNQPTTLTLSWNPANGTETYRLQVSTNSAFTTMVFDDSTFTATSRQVGPLANNTTFYWRVDAKNIGGSSAWSQAWSFTTIVQLPSQVLLISPSDAAVISADSVRFRWQRSGPAVSRYWFEIATDSLLTNPIIDSTLAAADTTKIGRKLSNNQTYWWRVRAGNAAGWGPFSAQRKFHMVITSVHAREGVPAEFRLSQNYPNPFNPSTAIEYALPKASHVELKVYDVLGNEVQTLVNDKQAAGVHRVQVESGGLPGGVYFYRLRAGERVEVKKMLIVK
jgi:PKD repeat protein